MGLSVNEGVVSPLLSPQGLRVIVAVAAAVGTVGGREQKQQGVTQSMEV